MKMQGRAPYPKCIKYLKKATQNIQPSMGAFWAGSPRALHRSHAEGASPDFSWRSRDTVTQGCPQLDLFTLLNGDCWPFGTKKDGHRRGEEKTPAEITSCLALVVGPVMFFLLGYLFINDTCRGLLWPQDPLFIHVISNSKGIQWQTLCQGPKAQKWTRQDIHPWEASIWWWESLIFTWGLAELHLSWGSEELWIVIFISNKISAQLALVFHFSKEDNHMERHNSFSKWPVFIYQWFWMER